MAMETSRIRETARQILADTLGIGIGDNEFDAFEMRLDHVVDGVATGSADTDHGDPRLQLTGAARMEIDHRVTLRAEFE